MRGALTAEYAEVTEGTRRGMRVSFIEPQKRKKTLRVFAKVAEGVARGTVNRIGL